MNYLDFVASLILINQIGLCQKYKTLYERIEHEPEYSEFRTLIQENGVAKNDLHYEQLTVFVPENAAFDHFETNYNYELVLYHMSFEIRTLETLNRTNSISTVNLDMPPLWITKKEGDIYVNNAKIIQEKSNYVGRYRNDGGQQQVLHVIDEVLNPFVPPTKQTLMAFDFLTSIKRWNLGAAKTVTNFLTKVQETKVQYVFKQNSGHTFFVPIDSGIDQHKFKIIDKNIIFGHVIPFHVLFTKPTTKKIAYESLANDDSVYIVLSFEEKDNGLFVKGLMKGTSGHGRFSSKILVPNIPVKNGVVHLISEPFGIYQEQLKPFPYLPVLEKISLDPHLDVFYNMGQRSGFNKIFSKKNVSFTYFVPNDASWQTAENKYYEPAESDVLILSRHLIISEAPYSIEQLLSLTKANNYANIELPSKAGPLRIMVLLIQGEYYLKWHNRYIKIERPNYECNDGVVHILASPLANFRRRKVDGRDFRKIFWGIFDKIADNFKDDVV